MAVMKEYDDGRNDKKSSHYDKLIEILVVIGFAVKNVCMLQVM